MKAFASWSGGKDAMLALHRFNNNKNCKVECLINMCDSSGGLSKSHGLKSHFIKEQAKAIGIPLIQQQASNKNYREMFIKAIQQAKNHGIEAGVFGDIFLEEHKVWIEDVCREANIKAVFPLWGNSTKLLLKEFINEGFQSVLVSLKPEILDNSWLGRIIDSDFYKEILQLDDVDPCAEFGEYHTFVFNGPNFNKRINYKLAKTYNDERYTYIEIE